MRLSHSPTPAPTTACFKGGAAQSATVAHARGVLAKEVTEAKTVESGQEEATTTTVAAPESALVRAGANGGKASTASAAEGAESGGCGRRGGCIAASSACCCSAAAAVPLSKASLQTVSGKHVTRITHQRITHCKLKNVTRHKPHVIHQQQCNTCIRTANALGPTALPENSNLVTLVEVASL